MKRKILTVKNQAVLYKKLKAYLEEILKDEEYFNSFEDLYQGAYRVKVYGRTKTLTPALIAEWLMGLPIGIEYVTYKICLMILEWLNIDKNQADELGEDSSIYLESQSDLDNFYWNTLGGIIHNEHFKRHYINVVKLLGHFCKVTAYTDKTIKIEDAFEWKHGDGFYSATFLTCDGAWIEVRVKTAYFEYWYSHFVEGMGVVQVEGRLCTEISRGTGIARNYIAIG